MHRQATLLILFAIGFVASQYTYSPIYGNYDTANPPPPSQYVINDTLPPIGHKISRIDLYRYIGQYGDIVGGSRSCWRKLSYDGSTVSFIFVVSVSLFFLV
jgi:hypothetical protein